MDNTRRQFLKLSGVGIAGVFILPLVEGCEKHVVTPLIEPSAEPFLTPVSRFFVQDGGKGAIPGWTQPVFSSADDWSLLVKNGNTIVATLSWGDLMGIVDANPAEEVTLMKTIQCVLQSDVRITPTGFFGNAYWTGIPLRLALEGLDLSLSSRIQSFLLTGADGFKNNISIDRLRGAKQLGLVEPLLVYKMNGEPLPPEHGFPVRLILLEGYGYMNVKWLTEVQAANFAIEGFGTYQKQGYDEEGIMRVNSEATSLFDNIQVSPGPLMIFGFALSGTAPIIKVEISIDGASPEAAEIVPLQELEDAGSLPPDLFQLLNSEEYPFRGVWAPWRFTWEGTKGDHTIAIRAFDGAGHIQPDVDENQEDGLNGIKVYRVTVT